MLGVRGRKDGDWGGVDGEQGIEKHLPSPLESRAVITGLRGGGKHQWHNQTRAEHTLLLTRGKGEGGKHRTHVTPPPRCV